MPVPDNPDPAKPVREGDLRPGSYRPRNRPGLEPIPMFDAAQTLILQIEILQENYDELMQVIQANEWTVEEGLTTTLLSGLGMQKGQVYQSEVSRLAAQAHGSAHASARVDDIVQELAAYHSMYSVMKYKAFKLYKLNQSLEFNNSGLRAQEDMWQEWAERMRRERETLNNELIRMRSLLSEFKLDWDDSGAPPLPPGVFASLRVKELENHPPAEKELPPSPPQPASEERPSFWARLRALFGRG